VGRAGGWEFYCENKETLGIGSYPGALAEYAAAPAATLCPVPPAVSDAEAAAMQPLADALLTVHDADITTGDHVAIIGAGVMGLQCGQIARQFGAGRVSAVDVDERQVALADDFGLDGILAHDIDPVTVLQERTDGVGPDVIFEAVGGSQERMTEGHAPLAQAFRAVRSGGTVVQVGILTDDVTCSLMPLRKKGVTWLNPISVKGFLETGTNSDTGRLAAQMVADERVSIDRFVTHELSGLASFRDAIEITVDKETHDAIGPAQIVLT